MCWFEAAAAALAGPPSPVRLTLGIPSAQAPFLGTAHARHTPPLPTGTLPTPLPSHTLTAVPYERLQARCGELVQFRWSNPSSSSSDEGQTVALLNATSSEDALGELVTACALLLVIALTLLPKWSCSCAVLRC